MLAKKCRALRVKMHESNSSHVDTFFLKTEEKKFEYELAGKQISLGNEEKSKVKNTFQTREFLQCNQLLASTEVPESSQNGLSFVLDNNKITTFIKESKKMKGKRESKISSHGEYKEC